MIELRIPREQSKAHRLLVMLQADTGARLEDMIEATGWQQHTVRAAMTGLRKRGFAVQRRKDGEQAVWFISDASK